MRTKPAHESSLHPNHRVDDIDSRWRENYQTLLTLRDQLIDEERNLMNTARELRSNPIMEPPAEIANQSYEQDLALGKVSYDQVTLDEVNAAIDRIVSGRYGICEITGKPISEGRLKAIPWTRFSLEAQKQSEAAKTANIVTLGPLEGLESQATDKPEELGNDQPES